MLVVKLISRSVACIISCYILLSNAASAQASDDNTGSAPKQLTHVKDLFDSDDVLAITLTGNLRELLNDRDKISQFHPMIISYTKEDSSLLSLKTLVRSRGHFRKMKEHCLYPPLLINFEKNEQLGNSVFKEQDNLKLVMPCKGDEFVVHEWLVYKLYNLVTPKSFRARLVQVKLEDTKDKKPATPFYGMLLEEHKQMAKRTGTVAINRRMRPEQTDGEMYLTMSVFEYLIGNTDWSVQYLQNIKLLAADSTAIPTTVPYDFDLAGIVNAPYALPAEELQMSSVLERRYRGFCTRDMKNFDSVIALFNGLKKDIYSVYTNCTLLNPKYVKSTIKYLDEFYETINNPAALKKEFQYPCDKNGTGNIVIKGMRED